jgi:hypothetical protein
LKKSINFVVLGDKYEDIIRELGGKKGTTTDIAIYDKKLQRQFIRGPFL